MKNKIAVIGGSGFVGTYLCNEIEKKDIDYCIYDINTEIDNPKNQYCDVTDLNSMQNIQNCSVIINLAAEHKDDVTPISKYDDVNVEGARNTCKIATKYGINKIIFTSSVAVYGFAPNNTDENGEINYFNDYGRTKFLAEEIYKNWQKEDPVNRTIVIIRPTVIFGPGNRGNVYNLLKQIADKRFIMIGDGQNIKSVAYVKNVVSFICHCINFSTGIHIYNYIDKPDITINELVRTTRKSLFNKENVGIKLPVFFGYFAGYIFDFAAKILNKKFPISSIRVKKFIKDSQFNSSLYETNFSPKFSVENALLETIDYEFKKDNSQNRTFDTE